MVGFSYVFLYSFNCSSHDMFLSIRMIFLRPLGILIGNHLSFNLPSGHAIRFFRLSNIDASWPDIFYRMSLLKWDMAVNSCLIAQSTCRHNHGLKRSKIFLWYTQLDIWTMNMGTRLLLGSGRGCFWILGLLGARNVNRRLWAAWGGSRKKKRKQTKEKLWKQRKTRAKSGKTRHKMYL